MPPKRTYTHLSYEERKDIEKMLDSGAFNLKRMAAALGRSEKAIRYEVTNRRYVVVRKNRRNKCGRQRECGTRHLCADCANGLCSACRHRDCSELCGDFVEYPVCRRIERFPYVCNGCPDASGCRLPRYIYAARSAQENAEACSAYWKEGPRKSDKEMRFIRDAFAEGIGNGLSIPVVIEKGGLPISVSTAYRYVEAGVIPSVKTIDLKRAVRYAPRKHRPKPQAPDCDRLAGRTFDDFREAVESAAPGTNVWEMDTVVGTREGKGKCVLTLLHRGSNLQLYFLLASKAACEVAKAFDRIKKQLGPELFARTFPIILCDNGTEFSHPESIEYDAQTGAKLTRIFYCRPRTSTDKARCEKNHEHFRECVPKGKSMDGLSDADICFVSLMVNNYPRACFDYHTPLEVAEKILGDAVLKLNGLRKLPIGQVVLKPIVR